MNNLERLKKLATLIRYYVLTSTTKAGSGHPTSCLSATDLMTVLMFDGFYTYDTDHPENPHNDRLIFSKGHAAPLLYSLYAAAGAIEASELETLRTFGGRLDGHPTLNFPHTEVPTGSLGQGLSIGLGMALNAQLDNLKYRTFVLLGDSEMAEGSVWEALESAAHYKLNNVVAIIDVNRLGQRGETMLGHDMQNYQRKLEAFGWNTLVIDGHSMEEIHDALAVAAKSTAPTALIAKTIKGKGISFLEDKENWHGKALNTEELQKALAELGEIDLTMRGTIQKPEAHSTKKTPTRTTTIPFTNYPKEKAVSTRKAYGNALMNLAPVHQELVVLDAETSNSTYAEMMKKVAPERFFEMYIAEQNMVGAATGLARRGKRPFISTFTAFFTRAHDQIRMAQYSKAPIVFIGSHGGVSIGEDGASQMALEDIALFRALYGSTVLYPSDAVSCEKICALGLSAEAPFYIRTTRMDTPILYSADEEFTIGGSKTLRSSDSDQITLVGAGITLHEALSAHELLKKDAILTRVIDIYSIKPIDVETLRKAAQETNQIVVIEDHYAEGGIGEAVRSALKELAGVVTTLAVTQEPTTGKPQELLAYERISADSIVAKVYELLAK